MGFSQLATPQQLCISSWRNWLLPAEWYQCMAASCFHLYTRVKATVRAVAFVLFIQIIHRSHAANNKILASACFSVFHQAQPDGLCLRLSEHLMQRALLRKLELLLPQSIIWFAAFLYICLTLGSVAIWFTFTLWRSFYLIELRLQSSKGGRSKTPVL